MKEKLFILILICFGFMAVSCNEKRVAEKKKAAFWENPVEFDLNAIKKRGFIRAVVDNSSTSYYIYRGRRMGYEYELLRNLAKRLDVQLRLIVDTDLMRAYKMLNNGEADIIAINLFNNPEREKYGAFTEPLNSFSSVLVQREDRPMVKEHLDLDGKSIQVKKSTLYKSQLEAIRDSLNINFEIVESEKSSDALVEDVVREEIDYTVVDKDVALVNSTYYNNLDVKLEIGSAEDVSWAVRKNAPELKKEINAWIERGKRSTYFAILYGKYFLNKKNSYYRNRSPFSSISGDRISVYDEIIKNGSTLLGWDWRLLASLVYKESRFDTVATSYAGAKGLLQLMPVTLARFGVENPNDPSESLIGGVKYLKYLDKFWLERVPEVNERIKFVLASYNVGHGHVNDAWRLALKFGMDTQNWDSVAYFLERKSQPEIYRDPVVRSGYAKGHLAVAYVQDVLSIYESYRILVAP